MPFSPGSAKRQLDLAERVRARGLLAEAHVLAAPLQVEEAVADALVGLTSTPVPSWAAPPLWIPPAGMVSASVACMTACWRL